MRTRQTIVGLALVASGAACGELATSEYQPPPIATISVELALHPPPAEDVRVLLVWQAAVWTTEPADVLLQSNPLTSGLAVSCPRPEMSCGGSGSVTCTTRLGLAEQVATLAPGAFSETTLPGTTETFATAELEVPIYALPPAGALRDLGDGERLAIGYLLFLPGAGGAHAASGPLANSAFNGPSLSFSTAYRTSYLVAYREGDAPVPACGASCGDPAGAPPPTNPGVLSRLPPGFSLVSKLEKADADGRLIPTYLASVPIGTRIAVSGHDPGEGGMWCAETTVHETWGRVPSVGAGTRCSSIPGDFACERAGGACDVTVEHHESCDETPPSRCVPGPSDADALIGSPLHIDPVFRRLPSGAVLAVPTTVTEDVGLYDPGTREWWPTSRPVFPRSGGAAADLPSGKVLVTGGPDGDGARSAEVYDPATGRWTRALSMRAQRIGHTATLLGSGKVLVIGGVSGSQAPATAPEAELYDPAEGTWVPFELGLPGLVGHTTVLLPGQGALLLVTGSNGGPETWLCTSDDEAPRASCLRVGAMGVAHRDGTFTVLPSGAVLALGGSDSPTSAELFDPGSEQWTPLTPMPNGRVDHAAVALPVSGRVVVAGGLDGDGKARVEVDVYNPGTGQWYASWPLEFPRASFAMFASEDDEVLVVGGPRYLVYAAPTERLCAETP